MFELNNVTFKHILHIQHVCLDRCVTCITGPSGSGKTTMLCLLNRLNEAEQGTILYKGEDIQKMNPMELRRRVVMLGQTPVIYPGDIEENLQIGLRLSGRLPATKQKLKEYLEKVDLHKELQESCGRLGSFTLKKVESLKYGLNKLFFCQIYLILYSYFKVLYGIIYIGR